MKYPEGSNPLTRWLGFFKGSTNQNKSQEASSLSTKTTFERREASYVSEFQGYLSGIPLDIRRIRNRNQAKSVTLNSVKMGLLKKCYDDVPEHYFHEKEELDFGLFFRSKRKTEESQQQIGEHLDQVELCLFNQVTSRFDEFVAVLRTIQALDMLVHDNLARIAIIKAISSHMRKKLLNNSQVILHLQHKKQNRSQVLSRLMLVRTALNAKQHIKNEITGNQKECTAFINQLKANKSGVQSLHCAKGYDQWVENCETLVERDLTENFSEWLFKYITLNVSYDRAFWEQLALRKDLIIKAQDLGNSTMLFDDELQPENRRLGGSQISIEMEDKIVHILLSGWGHGLLGVGPIKSALDQHFIQEFQNLLSDIRQFSYQRLSEVGEGTFDRFNMETLLEHMSIEFYSRVLERYSLILKRYFRRLFSVSKKCCQGLLKLSVNANGQNAERLQNIMQSLFDIQLFVARSNLQRFVKLVNIKRIGANVDYFRFKTYLTVLQSWESFFNEQVTSLYSKIQVPSESAIKERFYILKNKLNARYITQSKNELILLFFNNLHRYVLNQELKKSLEDDSWQVVDIPTSFYEPIGLLLSGESWSPNRRTSQNNTLESSIFVDRDTSHRNRSNVKSIDSEEKTNINFKLVKNECTINGKAYKFTQSFLLLIQMLEQYIRIYDSFPNIAEEVSSGIVEVCGFYNFYSSKMIVEAGAVHFHKLRTKNITARHLAISSLCLEFLVVLLQSLSKRIKMHKYQDLVDNIATHHAQISKKLRSILHAKISKGLPQIALQKVPSPGTLAIINSTKALFDILSEFYNGGDVLGKVFDVQIFSKYLGHLQGLNVKTLETAEILKQELGFFFGELQFLFKVVPEYSKCRKEGDVLIIRVFQSL